MRIGNFSFTGLFTKAIEDPQHVYDWCGLRARSDAFEQRAVQEGHQVDSDVFSYADNPEPAFADGLCRRVYEQCMDERYERIVGRGHSFGGAFFAYFLNWLERWHKGDMKFNRGVFYDPAPNIKFGQKTWDPDWYTVHAKRWSVPETSITDAKVFFQRAGRPLGVCGVPLMLRPGIENWDLSVRNRVLREVATYTATEDWQAGPEFDHCSLVVESRTAAIADAFLAGVLEP